MMLREEDGRLRVNNHLAPVILKLGSVVETTTTLQNNDILAVRSRMPNEFYPETCTGYVDPPSNFDHAISLGNPVIFEDDQTAIVNKPEGLDTIGKRREDLQSMLPFMLHPPTPIQKYPAQQTIYLPRPIHRLDRKTSGCVMVAKSKAAMKLYSQMFANSQIQKSYCAIVFGEPRAPCNDDVESVIVDGNAFFSIDYPIDGKGAMTLWRTVVTVTSSSWGKLSLLHVLPKTGRTHQIRRHLSYCLSTPIVGDSKYDGGGALHRKARVGVGMFLCSNAIQFCRAENIAETVTLPLPDKFYDILGIERNDVSL